MYYCHTRFYNPLWRRWLTLDTPYYLNQESITGMNLFVYCNNNPVMYVDESGCFAFLALTAIIGAVIGCVVAGVSSYQHGARGWEVVGWSTLGAVGGGVVGAGIGAGAATLATGQALASITTVYHGVQAAAWAYSLGGVGGLTGFIGNNLGNNANYYPVNDGFASMTQVTLEPGYYLQRIGGEGGSYVSLYFTDPFSLSLPYDKLSQMNNISVYEVVRPITVNAGPAIPFFGQYGGGIQYDLGKSIAELIAEGVLRKF